MKCECQITAVQSTIIGDGTVDRKFHRCDHCKKIHAEHAKMLDELRIEAHTNDRSGRHERAKQLYALIARIEGSDDAEA